jgi:hypothetical protein
MQIRQQNGKRILCIAASELQKAAANLMQIRQDPDKYGYFQCDRCHGYGSSLQEQEDKCTKCNGLGVVPKHLQTEINRQRHAPRAIKFSKKGSFYRVVTEGVDTGLTPGSSFTFNGEEEALRGLRTIWTMGSFESVIGEDKGRGTPPKDITPAFKDQNWTSALQEIRNLHSLESSYVSDERWRTFLKKVPRKKTMTPRELVNLMQEMEEENKEPTL